MLIGRCTSNLTTRLLFLLAIFAIIPSCTAQRIWVSTLVSADHGGENLLPHFVNHYHQLGITYRRFLILVHHTPGKYPRKGLEKISGTCQGYALECRLWEEPYDPEKHYELHLSMLNEFVEDAYDWIIVADSDELQQWPTKLIRESLDPAQQYFASHVMGYQVDRIAADGKTNPIQSLTQGSSNTPSLFQQYPLLCDPLDYYYYNKKLQYKNGLPLGMKVVAFRGYLRVKRNKRRVIQPDEAEVYLSGCSSDNTMNSGRPCPRGSLGGRQAVKNLYNSTYYSILSERYKYKGSPAKTGVVGLGFLPCKEYKETRVIIHHFRWHAGSVSRRKERLERYRGDCPLNIDYWSGSLNREREPQCTPLVPSWKDSMRLYAMLKKSGRVNMTGTQCHMPAVKEDSQTDTSYQGLAWEEFDSSLLVVSKVRNKVKGDSQTRMAFLKEKGEGGD